MSDQYRPPRRAFDPDAPVDPWEDTLSTRYSTPSNYSNPDPYSTPDPYSSPDTYPTPEPDPYAIAPSPSPSNPSFYRSPSGRGHSGYPHANPYVTRSHPEPSNPTTARPPSQPDYGYSHVEELARGGGPRSAHVRSHHPPRVTAPPPETPLSQPTPPRVSADLRGVHPADAPTRGYQPAERAPGFPGQVYGPPRHVPPRQRNRRRWPVALVVVITLLVGGFFGYRNRASIEAVIPYPGQVPATQKPALTPTPASSPRPTTVSKPAGEVGRLAKGLVLINTTLPGGGRAAGTGMVLTAEGRVLTNYHVVRGSDQITVIVATTGQKFSADVVGHDYSRDVALLQLTDAKDLETVVLDKDPVLVNDEVTAVGNTQGKGTLTATTGIVKALNQTVTIEGENSGDTSTKISGMIVSTVAAEPGDSGGPTYDKQGEVIGITSAGANTNDQSQPSGTVDGSEPLTFTIPINTAMSVVDQVLSGKQSTTVRIGPNGFLGVSVGKVSNGLGVVNVTTGSPAEKAGLASGDVITSVNGTTTKHPGDLTKIMQTTDPGDKLSITWIAGDGSGTRTETVTLVESPWN